MHNYKLINNNRKASVMHYQYYICEKKCILNYKSPWWILHILKLLNLLYFASISRMWHIIQPIGFSKRRGREFWWSLQSCLKHFTLGQNYLTLNSKQHIMVQNNKYAFKLENSFWVCHIFSKTLCQKYFSSANILSAICNFVVLFHLWRLSGPWETFPSDRKVAEKQTVAEAAS